MSALRSQKQPKAQQPVYAQRKKKDYSREAHSGSQEGKAPGKGPGKGPGKEGKESSGSPAERKLSDASNTSEDLSKDSGCASGKLSSSSDSSSEISDSCPSEGNSKESPSRELSWIDRGAYLWRSDGNPCVKGDSQPLSMLQSPDGFMDLMMGETTEDLVREVEDLRSENEYLKDEVEELRCEMLEMRDLFQEEEVYQLQNLKLQLDQSNKTCRVLQYRLRKAERRSLRVAQSGGADGELVRSLEHDNKVAKSVSLRLYSELEALQKKEAALQWENEALREKTQELEVAKQVLQAEVDKTRESTLKRKSLRSSSSRAEKRLSQQIEDDSADLRCQLHFAKEELSLMCKKLSKLVSESEILREELCRYQSPEGRQTSAHSREAEVKVHLRLVEEEATLLSRRIVELEVENRGLRAEMSDMRERTGRGGEEEEDMAWKEREGRLKQVEEGRSDVENIQITREGPVGGEWDPADAQEDDKTPDRRGMTKDHGSLLALRDHCCMLGSAVLLMTPQNSHPSSACTSHTEDFDMKSFYDALELLQAMLLAFIGHVETLLSAEDLEKKDAWDSQTLSFLCGDFDVQESQSKQELVEDLRTSEVKERETQTRQSTCFQLDLMQSCGDPKMRLSLQILRILHRWCQVKGREEGNEGADRTRSVLQGLLQDLAAELQDELIDLDGEAKATRGGAAEGGISHHEANKTCISKRLSRPFSPRGRKKKKNWCYLSPDAEQLDRENPVKTWDHLIMPRSFPDFDLEKISAGRSHTAPEKSTQRIYFSPPSARRVHQAQLKHNPESVTSISPWCSNLSDDMKEMTAGWRSDRKVQYQDVDVACSGTQTTKKPKMVSVALQTEGVVSVRSPTRGLSSSLVSNRSNHISTSLDGVPGRIRSTASLSSPKLYRRHSASGVSSSANSSSTSSRDRGLWSPNSQSNTSLTWTRQKPASGNNPGAKPPTKPAAGNRYGMVTEFLRRVSGRVEKPVPGLAQKTKTGLKNLERIPTRPPAAASLHRNDSVTRIVNQRFMKQREEKSGGMNHGVRQSPSTGTSEEGNYDCSSGGSLTFCFARPSRSSQKQTLSQSKLQRQRFSPPSSVAAD
ncbi:hypothetical protein CgunFtcFv8_001239 [Champsocephalus gunnari]|uniref:SOGA coiled-coil domain-containing protein n=1 Tax=Champsocephalus gunnari TaxID=52237 RepID=A0AAN8HQ89_CHAGU|nr:hypothetical protein CgunFtcFv8_001239 [Champsocephalus gunnari]